MKLIIAGSRDLHPSTKEIGAHVEAFMAVHPEFEITEVVSGMARGVDLAGVDWAKHCGIPVKPFPVTSADWKFYGKSAGRRRNRMMAEYADAALVYWDGKSRGSKHMHETMQELNKISLRIITNKGSAA